uniref:Uncharacterized protein n=1 Tax=Sphaeramia orbicularis TaxID=375764 RepID=A0A672Y492_9TELE
MGQHTLLHGEALLVVAAADAHHNVRNLRSSSTSISFWQPVNHCTFILPNRPYDGPPRKRDRISASRSHIDPTCYRENSFLRFMNRYTQTEDENY